IAALSTTRLIILASATLYREAWCALLSSQPYIRLVGASHDVAGIGTFLVPSQPTAILIDLPAASPHMAYELRAATSDCGLLFLVESYNLTEIVALLQAGATGCISRDDSMSDLTRAIIAVGRGEIVLPTTIAGQVLSSLANAARALAALTNSQPASDNLVEGLSERETHILSLLGQGLTNKDIAQTLIISVRTVEAHLRSIYDKLGVRSRTEAALWAAKYGYTEQPTSESKTRDR